MDKFDEILKNAVEGYKAPYDPNVWDNISSQLNSPFDQAVKDSVENYEAPYNAEAWKNVSRQLGPSYTALKWIGGAAAALTLLIGGAYYFQDDTPAETSGKNIASNDLKENGTEDHILTPENNSTQENSNLDNQNGSDDISNENNEVLNIIEPELSGNLPVIINEGDDEDDVDHASNNHTTNDGTQEPEDDELYLALPDDETNVIECNAMFNCNQLTACEGEEFVFSPTNMNQDVLYVWNFGDGNFSAGKIGKHTYKRAGTYTIELYLNDKKSNKTLKKEHLDVVVNPAPNTEFTWEESDNLIPSVTFINLTPNAQNSAWDIKGLKTSTANQFEYTFRKKGNYMVELTTENEFGCQSTEQKTITIKEDYNLLAPTAFTPNGDFNNDDFIPEALKLMSNPEFRMTIYDKNGKLVYQTNNVNQPWDGNYTEENTPAPAGEAYVWRVILKNANGEMEEYSGQVIIIR